MVKRFSAEVPDETHAVWHAYAKAHGCTFTTLLEQIAREELADYTDPGSTPHQGWLRRCTRKAVYHTKRNRKRKR